MAPGVFPENFRQIERDTDVLKSEKFVKESCKRKASIETD